MNSWGYGGYGGYSDYYGGGGFGGWDGGDGYDNGHYDGYNDYYGYGNYDNYDPYSNHYSNSGGIADYGIEGYGGGEDYGNPLTERNVGRMPSAEWDRLNERWDGGFEEYRYY